jgi:hypothetical protein
MPPIKNISTLLKMMLNLQRTLLALLSLPQWWFASCCLLVCASCGQENEVPAYLNVQPFTLTTSTAQGSSSSKITDAWVFVNGGLLGIFELPATFPIATLGKQKITLAAGIRENGQREMPTIYPFYRYDSTNTLTLQAGKTDTLRPKTSYVGDATFVMNEDCERDQPFKDNRDNITSSVFTVAPNGFEGNAAKLSLSTATARTVEKATTRRYQISTSANATYLELNYKTDALLGIGIVAYTEIGGTRGTPTTIYVLNPKKTWNKTYINLTQFVNGTTNKEFQFLIGAALPDSLTAGEVWIDNFRIIQR